VLSGLRGDRRPVVVIGVAVALLIGFVIVVAPLFNTSGRPAGELAGVLPTTAVAGRQLEIDIALDNTGVSVITQVCVAADVHGPLRPLSVVFQGLDHELFANGRACGGSLSGGETISLRLLFQALRPGSAQLALTPTEGSHPIGSTFSGSVRVTAAA